MLANNDFLFKQITELIADTDFSGYTIQYPPLFTWGIPPSDRKILNAWEKIIKLNPKHLGLYIHFPYCKQRCLYCRYFSVEVKRMTELDTYLSAFKKEIEIYSPIFYGVPIYSLYFGGGTPSLLSIRQLDKLFAYLYKNFNLSECKQIIFEGNPDFLKPSKLRLLKQYGVNRLTIGVQSLDPKVIKKINRYQTEDSFLKCFEVARKEKIENINVDLMVGLPFQTVVSAIQTLKKVIALRPEMIHVHPFYPTGLTTFMQKGNVLTRRDMDMRQKMSILSQGIIRRAGYKPLPFDASGLKAEARNIQLSDAIEYNAAFLGIGAAAASHATNHFRYINTNNINDYISNLNKNKLPILSLCRISIKDEMIYFITTSLRYGKIDKLRFKIMFNKNLNEIFQKEIKYLERRDKIKDTLDEIISLMQNIGEYLVFSKYFYSKEIVNKCKKKLGNFKDVHNHLSEKELKYILI